MRNKKNLLLLITLILVISCGRKATKRIEEKKEEITKKLPAGISSSNMILDELYRRKQIAFLQKDSLTTDLENVMSLDSLIGRSPASFVDLSEYSSEDLFRFMEAFVKDDNRKDYFLVNKQEVKDNFKGVAVVMFKKQIKEGGIFKSRQLSEKEFKVGTKTYSGCSTNKYFEQFILAQCTAFAISRWHIVTAGHEINKKNFRDYEFVFDMIVEGESNFPNKILSSNRFRPLKIEKHKYLKDSGLDYTILRVDKPIPVDRILKVNLNYPFDKLSRIYTIGAAEGLPLKYAPDGFIDQVVGDKLLSTDLNVFEGNSGSPVFNQQHEVIGMILSGKEKHFLNRKTMCVSTNSCFQYNCREEYVLKIDKIPLKTFIKK